MYLSRVKLNTKRRPTIEALATPQMIHGAAEASFPMNTGEARERILWRVDYFEDNCYLLVLSGEKPDFTHIINQFGFPELDQMWETKNYENLLARLQEGQSWRFRLRANPVHSVMEENGEASRRGKVLAHVTPQQQKQWLMARAQTCGFSLEENAFNVVHTEWMKFHKKRGDQQEISLKTAAFEGALTISDVESFKKTLLSGIGRAKAYGCGLLTIAHPEGGADG